MDHEQLLRSFVMAGYECSAQRRHDGRRLDMLHATGHARWAEQDYQQLAALGIHSVRDGVRWHLIDRRPYQYDWSEVLPMIAAARRTGIQVVWDLCHYGYPDDLDIWRPAFVERFARFAAAFASLLADGGEHAPLLSPINEISFWSWAGGEVGYFNPCATGRGQELKHQLVRASIAAIQAIREVVPAARFLQCDPLINVLPTSRRAEHIAAAEAYRLAQYESWDLLTGRSWPGLGGQEACLDIVGANFYPQNQWYFSGEKIPPGHADFRPLQGMLSELHQRYQRPVLLAETGAEDTARVPWLCYVSAQLQLARSRGVPIIGLCWYPFLDYPGWDDDRYCPTGVFGYPDASGSRAPFHPLHLALQQTSAQMNRQHCNPRVSHEP
ncbi:beta-glucosidase [Pseudomonas sp. NPDC089408]|uniref:beta-glucosidase n=1 Tax=Pseudomonas sp. NPDC089408 TaxID=3364465 RepID=UPI0038184907